MLTKEQTEIIKQLVEETYPGNEDNGITVMAISLLMEDKNIGKAIESYENLFSALNNEQITKDWDEMYTLITKCRTKLGR